MYVCMYVCMNQVLKFAAGCQAGRETSARNTSNPNQQSKHKTNPMWPTQSKSPLCTRENSHPHPHVATNTSTASRPYIQSIHPTLQPNLSTDRITHSFPPNLPHFDPVARGFLSPSPILIFPSLVQCRSLSERRVGRFTTAYASKGAPLLEQRDPSVDVLLLTRVPA